MNIEEKNWKAKFNIGKNMKCLCYICGKEFNRKPALIKRAKNPVCSRECQTELKKVRKVVKCVICGKDILRSDNRLKIRPNPICSKECRKKLQHNLSYNPNITDEEREKTRKNPQNREFIKKVLERDNYTCQICKNRGGGLVVHHISGYNHDKKNRYNINNGVVLCEKCHITFHKKYGYGNNTKEQYIEYANQR